MKIIGICGRGKEKSNTTVKTNNANRGNISEAIGERKKIKKIQRQDQTIQLTYYHFL